MREIVIRISCDNCFTSLDEEDMVYEAQITANGGATYEAEFCSECWDNLVEKLRTKLPAKKTKNFDCDHCGKKFATERGRNTHSSRMHG